MTCVQEVPTLLILRFEDYEGCYSVNKSHLWTPDCLFRTKPKGSLTLESEP